MLNSLRKGAGGWVAKIMFGFLVLSFMAWGVGDWTGNFSREKLAEVGGREISSQEFERAYQAQISMVSNQIGRQITSAEVREHGLTQRVLQNLVAAAAVNIHAEQMNLGLSDKAVAENIRKEESFEGEDGKFSRAVFEQVLRTNGLTEPGFIEMQRKELVRSQIVGTLTEAPYAPRTLIEAMHRFRNDERTLKYFILPAEAAGKLDTPSEDALKAYYEENKRKFMAPEFRRAGLVLLSPDKLKETVAISDAELKAAFEANKKTYSVPERRTIQQLVFKDMAAAQEASGKLASGADFMAVGKEIGLKETDINLGSFAKDEFADQKVAEAAFAQEKDKPSAPVAGFSSVIVRVTDIATGSEKTFDEVKDQVREQLAKARAGEEIAKLYDQIEDERAGGATLQEIAQKVNLEFQEIIVNKQGAGRDGKQVEAAAKAPGAVKLIFESDVGVENNPVSLGSESYAFVDVAEVIPERQRPFEEVREDVAKAWADKEIGERLSKKSEELITALGKGQTLEEAAAAAGATAKTTPPLKRSGAEPGLPISAIKRAFALPQGGFASAQPEDKRSVADKNWRAIFQVASVADAPALDDKGAEQLRTELSRGMGNDIFAQYVNGLQTTYGVQVNAKAISTVTGQQQQ